jgi:hypothetical protein
LKYGLPWKEGQSNVPHNIRLKGAGCGRGTLANSGLVQGELMRLSAVFLKKNGTLHDFYYRTVTLNLL